MVYHWFQTQPYFVAILLSTWHQSRPKWVEKEHSKEHSFLLATDRQTRRTWHWLIHIPQFTLTAQLHAQCTPVTNKQVSILPIKNTPNSIQWWYCQCWITFTSSFSELDSRKRQDKCCILINIWCPCHIDSLVWRNPRHIQFIVRRDVNVSSKVSIDCSSFNSSSCRGEYQMCTTVNFNQCEFVGVISSWEQMSNSTYGQNKGFNINTGWVKKVPVV